MIFQKTTPEDEKWIVVYDKAIKEDGSLLFPEKLSYQFLGVQRRMLGTYIFTNQYLNEILPAEDQDFKRDWLVYYKELPKHKSTFAFIDPAISLDNDACYTAVVVVDIDINGMWYLKVAKRLRITATQTVKLIFDIYDIFKPQAIGVEIVAYQEALMHFIGDEIRRTNKIVPVIGVRRGPDKSKSMRIRSLVPRFEWGRIQIKDGLYDFEDEYLKFPRGSYVDILDALSSIEDIASTPAPERKTDHVPSPNSKDYERYYIQQLLGKKAREAEENG